MTRAASLSGISLLPEPLGDHEVVVDVEPPREAEAAVENARRHERGRAVAASRERFRESRDPRRERGHAVVANAVGRGLETGQDRAVGGQRQRRCRQRVPEANARLSQGVEVRRQRGAALDPPDVIRPRRIERDQDDRRGGGVAAASQPSRRSGVKPTIMGSDPAQKNGRGVSRARDRCEECLTAAAAEAEAEAEAPGCRRPWPGRRPSDRW